MEKELRERIDKVGEECHLEEETAPILLKVAIGVVEAVKAHRIQSGFYLNSDIQAMDQVSGILRNSR